MAVSRAQLQKELVPGLHALFGLTYKQFPEEHKMLFETVNSDRAWEEELKLAGFGLAGTKSEGSAVTYDNAQEAWSARYNHETITLGFAITEEAIEDNLYDSLSARYTKALAKSMAETKQIKAASVYNNAFNSSFLGGDGVSLCNTAHPTVAGFTNSNTSSTNSDLNETSVENMWIQLSTWVDERGLKIAAKSQKLIIHPQNAFVAERLVKAPANQARARQGTADNDISAMNSMGVFSQGYMIAHYLTTPLAWFVTTDVPDGMKHFVRTSLKTDTSGDFDTGNFRYKSRERYSFGWTDPLGIWGSQG